MPDFIFGVDDCKAAAWTATGSYGTAVDLVAISQFEVTEQTTNAPLEGDDQVVATHAKSRVVQVRARFAFRDYSVYTTMTGASSAESGSGRVTTFESRNYPYIGLIAKIDEVNATGCRHIFVPKCKVMEGFSVSAQYGQFVTPEITLMGVADGPYGMWQIYDYDEEMSLVMPPV